MTKMKTPEDFSRPRKLLSQSFRTALRQHKPSEWAELGFCVQPDGRKHSLYYVSLADLLAWGCALHEMRRRAYTAQEAERYLWSVYERYVPHIYQFFEDVREGQLEARVKAYCEANFPAEWPFK